MEGEHGVEQKERERERELRACRLLLLQLTVGSAVDLSDCSHERRRVCWLCAARRCGGEKRRRVCSESGEGKAASPSRDFFVCLFLGHNLEDKSLAAAEGGVGCGLPGAFFYRQSVKQVSGKTATDVFWWKCGRLRNESCSEAPAALPAVLLLRSWAAHCHLAHSGHPGTR